MFQTTISVFIQYSFANKSNISTYHQQTISLPSKNHLIVRGYPYQML